MPRYGQKGFTLVEIVMTIVIIGIIAGTLAPVIQNSVRAYVDTQSRSHLFDKIRVSLGRLARELRQATIPLTSASGSTLQFVTTTVGGGYISFNATLPKIANADCTKIRNQSPSQLQRFLTNEPIGTLCVLYPGTLILTDSLIIGRDIVPITSVSAQTSGSPDAYDNALWHVIFTSEHSFSSASSSAANTFSLADFRHQVSLSGTDLIWQRDVASAANFSTADSGILLNGVTNFTTSLDSQKGIVSISLTVTEGTESITVNEDVYVRN
jgi:prepilin-type N-terminal cleavage/methylation domain-containing protein